MSWNGRNSLQHDNSLFRRKSYDQGRRSASVECRGRNSGGSSSVKPRASSGDRNSGNHCWNGRRSSVLGEAKPLKEQRPLNDKAYQKRKIADLVEFLQETSYKYPITASKLVQPSKKDFENIFQHFINFWDTTYVVKRIEEEAPKILKDLCYPFIPNKSAFLYVARTNWPPLLGVLLFLMDVTRLGYLFDPQLILNTGDEEHKALMEFIYNRYSSRNLDEEGARKGILQLIRKTRIPCDIDELLQVNMEKKSKLETLQNAIDKINSLKLLCTEQNGILDKYKDFFLKMNERMEKKIKACETLSEELSTKESELSNLNAIRDRMQDAYDAQGFDGKKQKLYYDEQKKELLEKLQEKKATLKDFQQKCWETEMQHSQTLDKGVSTCESFNELYSSVSQMPEKVLDSLKEVQDPQVRSLCSNLQVNFPDCQMRPMHSVSSQLPKLEVCKQKIDSTKEMFQNLTAKKEQIYNEKGVTISKLSAALKVVSVQETRKEQELRSNEMQAKEKWKELESKCDEALRKMEKLRAERTQAENMRKELLEEFHAIENLKKEKQEMLDDYLKEQTELFSRYEKTIKETEKASEEYGEKIYEALKKYIK